MVDYIYNHLVVRGKWKSPSHSSKKELDDSHEIKDEILDAIGRKLFIKKVGKNPDIGVDKDGYIFLESRDKSPKRRYYETKLKAEDFFFIRLIPHPNEQQIEIEILDVETKNKNSDVVLFFNIVSNFQNIYIIPREKSNVVALINSLIQNQKSEILMDTKTLLIIFR